MSVGEVEGRAGEAARTAVPVRLAAVFLPAGLPRDGRIAFWDPDGGGLPEGERTELTVVRRHGAGVRRGPAPALSLAVGEALPLLVRARRDPAAHPATACWGAAALHALRLLARGRLLPGLTRDGHDAEVYPLRPMAVIRRERQREQEEQRENASERLGYAHDADEPEHSR